MPRKEIRITNTSNIISSADYLLIVDIGKSPPVKEGFAINTFGDPTIVIS